MEIYIVRFFILFSFYILGAYATTDIPRLLRGSTTPMNESNCYCPVCGYKIPLSGQIPVFSYVRNNGLCRCCGTRIPFSDIFLELFIFLSCTLIVLVTDFSVTGLYLCILFYEGTKLFYLIRKKPRETDFLLNLVKSLLNNLIIFLLLAVLFGLILLIN